MRELAVLKKVKDKILLRSPYHPGLVDAIRGIPGRRWNGEVWSFPAASEQQVREIVREFYQIEGEPCYVQFQIVRARIRARRYGTVRIDGHDIVSATSGYLDMQPNTLFEILDYAGGFTEPYRRASDRVGGFEVDYTLRIRMREDAKWSIHVYGGGEASYEILSDGPIEAFLQSLMEKE